MKWKYEKVLTSTSSMIIAKSIYIDFIGYWSQVVTVITTSVVGFTLQVQEISNRDLRCAVGGLAALPRYYQLWGISRGWIYIHRCKFAQALIKFGIKRGYIII